MCFSAAASFGSGVVLAGVGVVSLRRSKRPGHVMFNAIPLIFAAQQLIEGVVWFSFTRPGWEAWKWPAVYGFLLIAQVIWPLWVPVSVYLLEKQQLRKRLLGVFSIIGVTLSVSLAWCLVNRTVFAEIKEHHIVYTVDFPADFTNYGALCYVLATVVAPLVSGVRRMWLIGFAILLSYVLTKIFLYEYFVSVWCFFAALISALVILVLRKVEEETA